MKRTLLRAERTKRGMTQHEVINRLGISAPTYSGIERGYKHGNAKLWMGIKNLFHLDGAEVWAMIEQGFIEGSEDV